MRPAQVLLPWTAEGGVAKLDSNKPAITAAGDWLIAFWREQGGSAACERNPEMHGVPGVLLSADQVLERSQKGFQSVWGSGDLRPVRGAQASAVCGAALLPVSSSLPEREVWGNITVQLTCNGLNLLCSHEQLYAASFLRLSRDVVT